MNAMFIKSINKRVLLIKYLRKIFEIVGKENIDITTCRDYKSISIRSKKVININTYKLFVFDLDDTLYYEKQFVLGGFREVSIYLSKKYNKDFNTLYDKICTILDEKGRGKIFDILCDEYGFKEDINDLVKIYRRAKPELELYDDSKRILSSIRKRGLFLGLITDGCSSVQWNKIKSLKLESVMDKIIVTDDYGHGYSKPHEKSYIEMMQRFNLLPSECVYIGDNPNKDFITAKKLGMKTIRIIRENGDHIKDIVSDEFEADYTISNFDELSIY